MAEHPNVKYIVDKYFQKIEVDSFGYTDENYLGEEVDDDAPFMSLLIPDEMLKEYQKIKGQLPDGMNFWEATNLARRLHNYKVTHDEDPFEFSAVLSYLERKVSRMWFERLLNGGKRGTYSLIRLYLVGNTMSYYESLGDEEWVGEEPAMPSKKKWAGKKPPIKNPQYSWSEKILPLVEEFVSEEFSCLRFLVQAAGLAGEELKGLKIENGFIVMPNRFEKIAIPSSVSVMNVVSYNNGVLDIRLH